MQDDAILKLHCRPIWAYSGAVTRGGRANACFSTHYFAWLLLRGRASFGFGEGRRFELEEGFWGVPSPLRVRSQEFSGDAILLSIRFRFEWLDGALPLPIDCFMSFPSQSIPKLETLAKKLVAACAGFMDGPLDDAPRRRPTLAQEVRANALFWSWLELFLKAVEKEGASLAEPAVSDARVWRMIELLNGVKTHVPVPYEDLRRSSGLGKVQIDRLFKAHAGLSPKAALTRAFLERCKDRLLLTRSSVKALADELGFQDASQFCLWFKRNAGSTSKLQERQVLSGMANGAPA